MQHNQQYIEHLVARKMSGEISPKESEILFEWIASSDENKQVYQKMMKMLVKTYREDVRSDVWRKVKDKSLNKSVQIPVVRLLTARMWRVAAILVLIALLPFVLGKYGENEYGNGFINTVKGEDITTSFYLPDGSRVILSKGSEISYRNDYFKNNRELILKGKAYIEIEPSSMHPVVVNAGDKCAVAQKGSFSISCNSNNCEVAVEEGTATVIDTSYKKVILPMVKLVPAKKVGGDQAIDMLEDNKVSKGQRISIAANGETVKTVTENKCEMFSWKDRIFCIHDLKTYEIAKSISEWYGKQVEFKGTLDHYKLHSATIADPSVKELLDRVFGGDVKSFKETRKKITVIFS